LLSNSEIVSSPITLRMGSLKGVHFCTTARDTMNNKLQLLPLLVGLHGTKGEQRNHYM
jgi:predicted alpha/beta-fold hydrolase